MQDITFRDVVYRVDAHLPIKRIIGKDEISIWLQYFQYEAQNARDWFQNIYSDASRQKDRIVAGIPTLSGAISARQALEDTGRVLENIGRYSRFLESQPFDHTVWIDELGKKLGLQSGCYLNNFYLWRRVCHLQS